MRAYSWIVSLSTLIGICGSTAALDVPKAAEEIKILARAAQDGKAADNTGNGPVADAKIIRSDKELQAAWGKDAAAMIPKLLKVPSIDFKENMLIHLTYATVGSGGYRVEVTKAEVKGDAMIVHWRLHGPPPCTPVAGVLSAPGELVMLKQFAGKINFVREKK